VQQALVGNNTDEEVLFSPVPKSEADDNIDVSSMRASCEQAKTTCLLYLLLKFLLAFWWLC
jgi:hypothetical protein